MHLAENKSYFPFWFWKFQLKSSFYLSVKKASGIVEYLQKDWFTLAMNQFY
jgi:hypothetical protein